MPLRSGSSREVVSHNIDELTHHGSKPRSHKQIVAIALSNADRHPHASGGRTGLASGGFTPSASPPWVERQEARGLEGEAFHPHGLFNSDVAGRTDRLPRAVAADSFVMPADVVSGLGQGNTLAGAKIMDAILKSGPYGTSLPHHRAAGGNADGDVSHVMVAGGEYLVPRDKVAEIGHRMRVTKKSKAHDDLAAGHEALRGLVEKVRTSQKKFLATAPKPKK